MKIATTAALVALSLLGTGCSGCTALSALTNYKGVLSATTVDEKALYAAEAAFYGANTAAEAAVDNGLLKAGSPDAVKVADWLQQAHQALLVARAAYAAGDAGSFTAKIAAVQNLVAQAWALIPQKKV
jgi:hypothetical protein